MPNRWICAVIIFMWISTTGWLFWTEVLPDLIPGEPPPFSIDMLDESSTGRSDVLWMVRQDGTETHLASTRIEFFNANWADRQFSIWNSLKHYPTNDTFQISIRFIPLDRNAMAGPVIYGFRSAYIVTLRGDLRATQTEVTLTKPLKIGILFSGEVVEGQFLASYQISGLGGLLPGLERGTFQPIPARSGSVLDPMHPVNRIRGLRLGQEWRMTLIDPVNDLLSGSTFNVSGLQQPERSLHARVLPALQFLNWRHRDRTCFVVEYEGKNVHAKTWVEKTTGLVLQQEASGTGPKIVLTRESDIEGVP